MPFALAAHDERDLARRARARRRSTPRRRRRAPRPRTRHPAAARCARAMFATRACGRCSSAPAEARTALGGDVGGALGPVTSIAAPAASADRAAAPRFWGSVMPSSTTTMASSANGKVARSRSERTPGAPSSRSGASSRATTPWWSAASASSLARGAHRHPHARLVRAASSSARMPWVTLGEDTTNTSVARPARIASVTARRPPTTAPGSAGGRVRRRCAPVAVAAHRDARDRVRSRTAIAMQPTPSPWSPSPSGRVAFTETALDRQARAPPASGRASRSAAAAIEGRSADHREVAGDAAANPARATRLERPGQEVEPGDPLDRGIGLGEVLARRRRARAAQQRVGERVARRRRRRNGPARPSSPSNRTPPSISGRLPAHWVDVEAEPDPRSVSAIRPPPMRASACARSNRVVIFVFIGSPGHRADLMPGHTPAPRRRR